MRRRNAFIVYTLIFILIVFLTTIFFDEDTVDDQVINKYDKSEAEAIRNRPFPLAGEEQFGNDAGMETGDEDQVELINREPVAQ